MRGVRGIRRSNYPRFPSPRERVRSSTLSRRERDWHVSIHSRQRRAGKIEAENARVRLPRLSHALRTILAQAHAVAETTAADRKRIAGIHDLAEEQRFQFFGTDRKAECIAL